MKFNIHIISAEIIFAFFAIDAFAQVDKKFRSTDNKNLSKTNNKNEINSSGEVQEERVAIYNGVGGFSHDEALEIAVDSFGNAYVTGSFEYSNEIEVVVDFTPKK